MLQIYLFGSLRLVFAGAPLKFTALPKTVPLLTHLLLARDKAVGRDQLAFLLWPDLPESEARGNLRRHLHDLRRILPPAPSDAPWLLVNTTTLQWNPESDYWLDIAAFQSLSADPTRLREAVALYTSPLLPNLYEDWIIIPREQLHNLLLDDLLQLVQQQARQNYGQAIADAQRVLQHDPLREDVVRLLMTLRHQSGDRAGALQEYQRFVQRLRQELDVPPMLETSALYDALARQITPPSAPAPPAPSRGAATLAGPAPAAISDKASPNNLPAQLTAFIGREKELAAVRTLLTTPNNGVRLLTLTGPGGCGKTRLALEVATRIRTAQPDLFPSGYYFVSFSNVSEPSRVLSTLAEALGIHETVNETLLISVKEFLRLRQLLLILDNFEHITVSAPTLTDLLAVAPGLRMLVTSRAVLHLYGEHEFPVAPLPLPESSQAPNIDELAHCASVALFTTRSRAVNPHFVLTRENAAAVAEICIQLDGLPLAIELAAARSKLLSPQALLARLNSRLSFLTDRNRNLTERHQTLRATLAWSYNLLNADEKRLFHYLAVFAGSFSYTAAEAICTHDETIDVLAGIEALVDNSLLDRVEESPTAHASPGSGAPELRFRMLSTIREYARELLDQGAEAQTVRSQHAQFYTQLAQAVEPKLQGGEQAFWLSQLEVEHANLRAALSWCLEDAHADALLGLRLAATLGLFWVMYGYLVEGYRWLSTALTQAPHAPAALRAKALYALGAIIHAQGDLRQAPPLFAQSLALYQQVGDQHGIADAFYALGRLANRQGRYAEAEQLLGQSLALTQEIGYGYRAAYVLNILAFICIIRGDMLQAQATYEQALASARTLQDKSGMAFVLTSLGELARQQNDYLRAEGYYNEGMALARELGQKARVVMLLHNLAYVTLRRGDGQRAARLFRESLTLGLELPDKENFGMCLLGLGCVSAADPQLERAVRLFAAGEQTLEQLGAQLAPADQIEYDRSLLLVRSQLDPQRFTLNWESGRRLSSADAEALALSTN
jgi:predicted ATPase/DNA-binding SARP family transcriptional activator